MDVVKAMKEYITKMVSNDNAAGGMKAMLFDKDTAGMVSLVFPQSSLMQREVYLFERIESTNRTMMDKTTAIVFVRPTPDNIKLLAKELRKPTFHAYRIYFSNALPPGPAELQMLAEADEMELVHEVQEFYGDYFALNKHTFVLNMPVIHTHISPMWSEQQNRITQGIASCLLSLKKQPDIRYSAKSELAQRVVEQLLLTFRNDRNLYDFGQHHRNETAPLLLILDRRDDPVTPLLTQWTYEAMVHELIGINNQRVDLSRLKKKDLTEVVLNAEQDSWYANNVYSNFGDLGANVKKLVDDYAAKTQTNSQIDSIDDIKKFVANYPEFRKLAGNVSKHVNLLTELSRIVEQRQLMEVSELEQSLANHDSHSKHVEGIRQMLNNNMIDPHDKLKLVLLYAFRYENNRSNAVNEFTDTLVSQGIHDAATIVHNLRKYSNDKNRTTDIFDNKTLLAKYKGKVKRGLKNVENIYTEHKPLLRELLEAIASNRLKPSEFPEARNTQFSGSMHPPQDIIVFIIGGVTYEEAFTVNEFMQMNSQSKFKVVLGGTSILNSRSFMDVFRQQNREGYHR